MLNTVRTLLERKNHATTVLCVQGRGVCSATPKANVSVELAWPVTSATDVPKITLTSGRSDVSPAGASWPAVWTTSRGAKPIAAIAFARRTSKASGVTGKWKNIQITRVVLKNSVHKSPGVLLKSILLQHTYSLLKNTCMYKRKCIYI